MEIRKKIKKVIQLASMAAIAIYFSGCTALQESIDARTLLGKCEYSVEEVQLKLLDFTPMISFDNSSKKFNVKQPSIDMLAMAEQIKNKEFQVNFSEFDLVAKLKINNPNPYRVEVDSLYVDTYLDESFLVKVKHPEHTTVPASQSMVTDINFTVPTDFPFHKVLDTEQFVFKGKVWLRMEIIEGMKVTLPVPFTVRQDVPKEQIQQAIDTEKEKLLEELLSWLEKKAPEDKVKDALKGLF